MDDASPLQGRDADRARELRSIKMVGDRAAGLDRRPFRRGAALRADALAVGLCCGLRGGGDGGRAGGLVCRGRAFPPTARPADPAHRHHSAQPRAHRRQSRQLHRDQLPGARGGREEAGRGRLRRRIWRRGLSDRARSATLAAFAVRMLPKALAAIDEGELRRFLAERLQTELQKIEIAPLVTGVLAAITAKGQHRRLLDELSGRAREVPDQRGGA